MVTRITTDGTSIQIEYKTFFSMDIYDLSLLENCQESSFRTSDLVYYGERYGSAIGRLLQHQTPVFTQMNYEVRGRAHCAEITHKSFRCELKAH